MKSIKYLNKAKADIKSKIKEFKEEKEDLRVELKSKREKILSTDAKLKSIYKEVIEGLSHKKYIGLMTKIMAYSTRFYNGPEFEKIKGLFSLASSFFDKQGEALTKLDIEGNESKKIKELLLMDSIKSITVDFLTKDPVTCNLLLKDSFSSKEKKLLDRVKKLRDKKSLYLAEIYNLKGVIEIYLLYLRGLRSLSLDSTKSKSFKELYKYINSEKRTEKKTKELRKNNAGTLFINKFYTTKERTKEEVLDKLVKREVKSIAVRFPVSLKDSKDSREVNIVSIDKNKILFSSSAILAYKAGIKSPEGIKVFSSSASKKLLKLRLEEFKDPKKVSIKSMFDSYIMVRKENVNPIKRLIGVIVKYEKIKSIMFFSYEEVLFLLQNMRKKYDSVEIIIYPKQYSKIAVSGRLIFYDKNMEILGSLNSEVMHNI